MKRTPLSKYAWLGVIGGMVVLSGCDTPTGASVVPAPEASVPEEIHSSQRVQPSITTNLSDVAEPFEALGEQAFSANGDELAQLFELASHSAAGLQGLMPPDIAQQLDTQMMDIGTALKEERRSDVALSAVEAFKLVVSQFPPDARVPLPVSYLDYAGFRIQADLKSAPIRWTDADDAMTYANEQWAIVRDQVVDTVLRDRFDAALQALETAIVGREAASATEAVIMELDMVDLLETYFQL